MMSILIVRAILTVPGLGYWGKNLEIGQPEQPPSIPVSPPLPPMARPSRLLNTLKKNLGGGPILRWTETLARKLPMISTRMAGRSTLPFSGLGRTVAIGIRRWWVEMESSTSLMTFNLVQLSPGATLPAGSWTRPLLVCLRRAETRWTNRKDMPLVATSSTGTAVVIGLGQLLISANRA